MPIVKPNNNDVQNFFLQRSKALKILIDDKDKAFLDVLVEQIIKEHQEKKQLKVLSPNIIQYYARYIKNKDTLVVDGFLVKVLIDVIHFFKDHF